jgi:ABC-type dipeptide/oligopeptide/nickel transport system ATPase subunit
VTASMPLLEARGLRMVYSRASVLSRFVKVALDGVDFHIEEGSCTGLAGGSGSGKSTLARCLAGIEKPTGGEVLFRGTNIASYSRAQRLAFRKAVQLVFQDAAGSLNPRFTAATAVSEPLRIAGAGNTAERRRKAVQLIQEVGLPASAADRPALEFSGGQRRRLTIARALAAASEVILFDEALSGMDESVQGSILELLAQLREVHRLTYLFISHDLGLLARICGEIAVLHRGRVVERALTRDLLNAPTHPYSQELVAAIPPLSFV